MGPPSYTTVADQLAVYGPLLGTPPGDRVIINSPGPNVFPRPTCPMSIRTRLLAIVKAAASVAHVRNVKAEPAPVFPMTVTRQDDLLSQVARLRSQGYSLRAVSVELGVSYRQARKLSAAGEAAGIW